jgi:hypothetical protein
VADKIAENMEQKGEVGNPSKLVVDGFEIVDGDDERVQYRGPWLPSFLLPSKLLPSAGTKLYFDGSELYVEQTDAAGPLLAASLIQVGSVPWLLALAALAFVAFVTVARWGARRFLRNYFALSTQAFARGVPYPMQLLAVETEFVCCKMRLHNSVCPRNLQEIELGGQRPFTAYQDRYAKRFTFCRSLIVSLTSSCFAAQVFQHFPNIVRRFEVIS